MSKSNDWYLRQMEDQFGDVIVSDDTPCAICGQPYGEHIGLECPIDSEYEAWVADVNPTFTEKKNDSAIQPVNMPSRYRKGRNGRIIKNV